MAVSGANKNRVYDSQDMMLSVNSFTEPSKLRPHEIQWGFNVMTRGGKVRTRLGFRSLFKYSAGKAQGLSFFIPNTGVPQLTAAISGRVFAIPVPFNTFSEYPLIRFNPQAPSVFFKEATVSKTPNRIVTPYPVLMMQDRYSRAAYTDGVISRHLDPTPDGFINPVAVGANETPIGFAMEWVGDRLWVERGREIFASDIADPLHFTENTYLLGGNSLLAIDGKPVQALKRTADNKQLIAFTDQNSTAIAAGITERSTWGTTRDFIKSLFPGVGCVGPKAVTDASGELAWMSQEGMRLYNAVGDSVFNAKNNVSSREMERSWQARSRKFMSSSCAGYHDGYTIFGMPCGDIFNRHIWVMDNSTSDLLDQQFPYAWNGVWTGIRPVEFSTGVVDGELRTFCMSQDRDAVRIWEMFREDRIDGDCDIVCYFESKGNVYQGESPVTYKRYKYSALHVADLTGTASVNLKYKNEFGCYQEVGDWQICATRCRPHSNICTVGNMRVLDHQRRYLKGQESEDTCEAGGSPFRSQVGTYHTAKASWVGRLSVRAMKHVADQYQEEDFGECQPNEECKELSCCDTEPDYISCNSDGPPYSYAGYYGTGGGVISIPIEADGDGEGDGGDEEPDEPHILEGAFDSFWNFEGTGAAIDSISAHNVAEQGASPESVGKVLNARDIDGSGHFESAGNNMFLAAGAPAIWEQVGWFYANSVDFSTQRTFFYFSGATLLKALICRNVAGTDSLSFLLFDGAAHQEILDTAGSVPKQAWVWYSASYDGSEMRLIVKEPLSVYNSETTRVYTAGPLAGVTGTAVFGDVTGGGQRFIGSLDATGLVLGRVLSTAERNAHYNSGSGIQYPFA